MPLHSYDPKNITLIYDQVVIEGFADGSFVNVEYNADSWTFRKGSDGNGVRSKTNDQSARFTITLMPGATGNLPLNRNLQADKVSNSGVKPISLIDSSTGDFFVAEGAWVVREPGQDYQTEAQNREWILEADDVQSNYGASV